MGHKKEVTPHDLSISKSTPFRVLYFLKRTIAAPSRIPFISGIRIESPDSYQGVQLKLFSYSGQLMKSVYIEELQESYELEGLDFLKSGVYFINLNSVDGKLNSTQKIVKF